MDQLVQHYLRCSLAPSTKRAYAAGQRRYIDFCTKAGLSPFPTNEKKLCSFAAARGHEGLKAQTIKGYLSAVRNRQIILQLGNPFQVDMPVLEYVLRGIKMDQAKHHPPKVKERLPITPAIMLKLREIWGAKPTDPTNIMLWAACCTAFFGFLRSGEITTPSLKEYDAEVHLSFGDISLDSTHNPTVAQVRIKASKTDPFRQGISIFLGRTDTLLCPIAALTAYMATRGCSQGPFFHFPDHQPLTRQLLVEHLRRALQATGLDPKKFAGHSFRIGAATTAAAHGLEDSLIRTLGRWQSSAYLRYLQIPREQLAKISRTLSA